MLRFIAAVVCASLCLSGCSAALVSVNYCNAYPGQYFSISWGSVTSTRIAYQSCATFSADNTVTAGTATVWSNSTIPTATFTNSISIVGMWCADSNRNIILAYPLLAGGLGITYPQQDGSFRQNCNALGSGNAVGYLLNVACGFNSLSTVDIVASGTVVKASVLCGTEYFFNTAPANQFFAGSIIITLNTPHTNTTVAGPFPLTRLVDPAADQSELIIISGDQNNAITVWTYTTTGAAPAQGSSADKAAAGCVGMLAAMLLTVLLAHLY